MERKPKDFRHTFGGKNKRELVMYDSDRHTFNQALRSIWLVTGYEEIQCEQLTILIHYKGHAVIKIGELEDLIPMMEVLIEEGYEVDII